VFVTLHDAKTEVESNLVATTTCPLRGGGASLKSPLLKKGRYTSAVSKNVVPRLDQAQSRIAPRLFAALAEISSPPGFTNPSRQVSGELTGDGRSANWGVNGDIAQFSVPIDGLPTIWTEFGPPNEQQDIKDVMFVLSWAPLRGHVQATIVGPIASKPDRSQFRTRPPSLYGRYIYGPSSSRASISTPNWLAQKCSLGSHSDCLAAQHETVRHQECILGHAEPSLFGAMSPVFAGLTTFSLPRLGEGARNGCQCGRLYGHHHRNPAEIASPSETASPYPAIPYAYP
jgi:hypothetical protein